MSDNEQLDRMEKKIDYLFDHIVKQEKINTQVECHFENHKKANKIGAFIVGIGVSFVGIFKGLGG
jgi:hypothetical protein